MGRLKMFRKVVATTNPCDSPYWGILVVQNRPPPPLPPRRYAAYHHHPLGYVNGFNKPGEFPCLISRVKLKLACTRAGLMRPKRQRSAGRIGIGTTTTSEIPCLVDVLEVQETSIYIYSLRYIPIARKTQLKRHPGGGRQKNKKIASLGNTREFAYIHTPNVPSPRGGREEALCVSARISLARRTTYFYPDSLHRGTYVCRDTTDVRPKFSRLGRARKGRRVSAYSVGASYGQHTQSLSVVSPLWRTRAGVPERASLPPAWRSDPRALGAQFPSG